MKHSLLLVVALSLLNSCGKSGCTDVQALNYDAKAKFNDESCIYFADAFIGKYIAYDSVMSNYGDSILRFSDMFDFEIKNAGENYIYFKNFLYHGNSSMLIVNTNHVFIVDSSDYPDILRKDFNFEKDTFFFKVDWFERAKLVEQHRGFAVKD